MAAAEPGPIRRSQSRWHGVWPPAVAGVTGTKRAAIGDIAAYPGKLKLILSGFAEAAQAAHAIRTLLNPGEVLHFEYSTTRGVPGKI